MNGEVSFFELGVNDPLTARDFYVELFGWEMNPGPSGEARGFQIQTGNVRGGLHGGEERASPYLFFKVEDIQAAAERVRALGGRLCSMSTQVPAPPERSPFARTIRAPTSACTSRHPDHTA